MAMSNNLINWLQDKFAELQEINEDKKPVLIEVKSFVYALDALSLECLAKQVNLSPCFECLKSSDTDTVEYAASILFLLLDSLPRQDALSLHGTLIQQAMKLEPITVKRTFLKILQKQTSVEAILLISTQHSEILSEVIQCLACPDRSIAEGAVAFFKKIGKTLEGIQMLFSRGFVDVLQRVMLLNDITRFRIYEIVVDIAVNSHEGLKAGHDSRILPSLLLELQSEDALVQLNSLELLTNLTISSMGLLYLQREGVIQLLVNRIINIKDDPLSFILLPGLIEFFGNLFKLQPTVFSQQHPEILHLLFDNFETVDPALLGVVISTVGKIGFSDEGKKVLISQTGRIDEFFSVVGKIIQRKDELCVTALNSLGALFTTQHDDLSEATKSWFIALGPNAMDTIASLAKLPFVELRLSALELINKLVGNAWGLQIICTAPGMLEFLLDRNIEFDNHCKRTKYNTVTSIVENPSTPSLLSPECLARMKQFVNEGPFYVRVEPETAFEGAS